ncbi:hypothetical protein RFI_26105 [Reticulomyxa filosa]|uniref:Uncharacterized protein n=1 Tax=Reticulomyxa filosa TaxID=46433 RepID=X6MBL4_RETFI|nr:hypothetical protein RFI_26105 [Reticulomyxa filosa]|eukprot:ETO11269.1 hypothetical protein RFI_26105 [Reticulomyxa filosa]
MTKLKRLVYPLHQKNKKRSANNETKTTEKVTFFSLFPNEPCLLGQQQRSETTKKEHKKYEENNKNKYNTKKKKKTSITFEKFDLFNLF